jgi:hypothetical protein
LIVATRVTVSPIEVKVFDVCESEIEAAATPTEIVVVAVADPDVAVMVADPSATEVTRPADDTVAALEFEVVQVTVAPDIVVPMASFTVATRVTVSPIEVRVLEVGVTEMVAADWLTVMALVAVADPDVAVMVALPSATEVTRPADDTVAALEFEVVQVTVAPEIAFPPESFTVAAMVTVSPIEVRVLEVGVTEMVAAVWLTVMALVAVADPDVAVMVALPSATEVTRPADDTVATLELEVVQVIELNGMAAPLESFTVAAMVTVSPIEVRVLDVGVTDIDAADWLTVMVLVAVADPDVAVMVAVPPATEVTKPALDTVATDELDVAHVTVAPEIAFPPESFTVAAMVTVSPIEVRVLEVGVRVMEPGVWPTVIVAVAL